MRVLKALKEQQTFLEIFTKLDPEWFLQVENCTLEPLEAQSDEDSTVWAPTDQFLESKCRRWPSLNQGRPGIKKVIGQWWPAQGQCWPRKNHRWDRQGHRWSQMMSKHGCKQNYTKFFDISWLGIEYWQLTAFAFSSTHLKARKNYYVGKNKILPKVACHFNVLYQFSMD